MPNIHKHSNEREVIDSVEVVNLLSRFWGLFKFWIYSKLELDPGTNSEMQTP